MKKLVLYHDNCPDGFGAAWVVRRALGEAAVEFHAAIYNRPPPAFAGRDVIMVDFCLQRPEMEQLTNQASSILVLDHHESAQKAMAGLTAPNLMTVFDMDKSGVGVAWSHFFPGEPMPRLLQHVQDMDIWRWQLPGTAEVMSALLSHPYDFALWDLLMQKVGKLRREGVGIRRAREKEIQDLLRAGKGLRATIGGYDVPVFNAPFMFAKLAHMAAEHGEPFGATFWLLSTPAGPRVKFSLRSSSNGLNVADIAAQYGGGGHAHAAGFEVPLDVAVKMLFPVAIPAVVAA